MNGDVQFTLTGKSGAYHPDNLKYGHGQSLDAGGFIQRMDNYLARFEAFIQDIERSAERQAQELLTAKKSQGQTFPQEARLETLRRDNREVLRELTLTQKDPNYKSSWKPSALDIEGSSVQTASKESTPTRPQEAEAAVRYVQVGDRGSFPIFNARRM